MAGVIIVFPGKQRDEPPTPARWLTVVDGVLSELALNGHESYTDQVALTHRIIHSILRGDLVAEALLQPAVWPHVDPNEL